MISTNTFPNLQVLEDNRRKLKTGFKLFQLAHRDNVIEEHGDNQVEKILSKMWNDTDNAEKRFFQDKAASYFKQSSQGNDNDSDHELDDHEAEGTSESGTSTPKRSSAKKSIGKFNKANNIMKI